jgi:hypothetical protein
MGKVSGRGYTAARSPRVCSSAAVRLRCDARVAKWKLAWRGPCMAKPIPWRTREARWGRYDRLHAATGPMCGVSIGLQHSPWTWIPYEAARMQWYCVV